jgi:hypothetical protein
MTRRQFLISLGLTAAWLRLRPTRVGGPTGAGVLFARKQSAAAPHVFGCLPLCLAAPGADEQYYFPAVWAKVRNGR